MHTIGPQETIPSKATQPLICAYKLQAVVVDAFVHKTPGRKRANDREAKISMSLLRNVRGSWCSADRYDMFTSRKNYSISTLHLNLVVGGLHLETACPNITSHLFFLAKWSKNEYVQYLSLNPKWCFCLQELEIKSLRTPQLFIMFIIIITMKWVIKGCYVNMNLKQILRLSEFRQWRSLEIDQETNVGNRCRENQEWFLCRKHRADWNQNNVPVCLEHWQIHEL